MQELDFYIAAAEIIPVLFLALLLEARFFQLLVALPALAFLALIMVGEFAALHVLDSGTPRAWAHEFVELALISEGGAIFGITTLQMFMSWFRARDRSQAP